MKTYTNHFEHEDDRPALGYTTYGDVRGGCGHLHGSPHAACQCREADTRDCRIAGGYSDRHVVAVVETIHEAHSRTLGTRQLKPEELW